MLGGAGRDPAATAGSCRARRGSLLLQRCTRLSRALLVPLQNKSNQESQIVIGADIL